MAKSPQLRVALVVGGLGQGGAEKQAVYMVRALAQAGVDIRVYCLTRGEFYESVLQAFGLQPRWIGQLSSPLARLASLTLALREFQPHIVQSAHFFTNLYVAVSARICRALAIGAIRNDTLLELDAHPVWGKWLLRLPPVLLANSYTAKRNAQAVGIGEEQVAVLPNVIDIGAFDSQIHAHSNDAGSFRHPTAAVVARLEPEKRLDRFLSALALTRQEIATYNGIIIGDGPERPRLERAAADLGLLPHGVRFLGRRSDVPALLSQAHMLLLTSDHEGFPNVILEAMAARLPVVTTPAGDAGTTVLHELTGYVVPFDDVVGLANYMVSLGRSPELCGSLGRAGRQQLEQSYSFEGLADRLLSIYQLLAERQGHRRILDTVFPYV